MRRGSLAAVVLCAVALGTFADVARARAQDDVAGAVRGQVLASLEEDVGGAVSADLWLPLDWFRVGGFIGVGALPAEEDARNRTFMPLGVSVGFEAMGDDGGISVIARGGLWAGATQEVKLTAGGFVAVGAYLLFALGDNVALDVGLDLWGVFGDGETVLFAPSVGLSWAPGGGE